MVFIGHEDAGKSTLGGQILFVTDQVGRQKDGGKGPPPVQVGAVPAKRLSPWRLRSLGDVDPHALPRFPLVQVDKRTIEKYEREAKDKNRESW